MGRGVAGSQALLAFGGSTHTVELWVENEDTLHMHVSSFLRERPKAPPFHRRSNTLSLRMRRCTGDTRIRRLRLVQLFLLKMRALLPLCNPLLLAPLPPLNSSLSGPPLSACRCRGRNI